MYFCVQLRVRRAGKQLNGRRNRSWDRILMPNHLIQQNGDERADVAVYVASMSADLANMARATGLDTLGYLLEMVRLEAENTARHMAGSDGAA